MTIYEADSFMHISADDSELLRRHQRQGFFAFLAVGVLWGLGTGFSHFVTTEEFAYWVQGPTLALVMALACVATTRTLTAWTGNVAGLMICLHVVAATLSGLVNGAHHMAIIRFVLLLPAISIMLAAVQVSASGGRDGLRAGLTFAGAMVVLYHLFFLDTDALINPMYRLSAFLGPNGIGFIAAMTGVSMLDYALTRLGRHRALSLWSVALLAMAFVCVVLCVATKSRTAMLAFTVGVVLRLYLFLGFTRTFLLCTAGASIAFTLAWSLVATFGQRVAEIFQFNDRLRGLEGGTGRFAAWGWIIREIIYPNFLIGVGPQQHTGITNNYINISSAHNGLLANLADTGIVGGLPLIIILLVCVRRGWTVRHEPTYQFAITLFAVGLVESMAETMFFSIGNPGSLLFMLAVAVLCSAPRQSVATPVVTAP